MKPPDPRPNGRPRSTSRRRSAVSTADAANGRRTPISTKGVASSSIVKVAGAFILRPGCVLGRRPAPPGLFVHVLRELWTPPERANRPGSHDVPAPGALPLDCFALSISMAAQAHRPSSCGARYFGFAVASGPTFGPSQLNDLKSISVVRKERPGSRSTSGTRAQGANARSKPPPQRRRISRVPRLLFSGYSGAPYSNTVLRKAASPPLEGRTPSTRARKGFNSLGLKPSLRFATLTMTCAHANDAGPNRRQFGVDAWLKFRFSTFDISRMWRTQDRRRVGSGC